jgi:hypothetical protein
LNIPFCFIENDLVESLRVQKGGSDITQISLTRDLMDTKFISVNSNEILSFEDFNQLNNFNFLKNDVFSGIDWIYSFVESMYAYNFRIFYYKYYNTFFDDSCDYFYNLFWFFTISSLSFQLL